MFWHSDKSSTLLQLLISWGGVSEQFVMAHQYIIISYIKTVYRQALMEVFTVFLGLCSFLN